MIEANLKVKQEEDAAAFTGAPNNAAPNGAAGDLIRAAASLAGGNGGIASVLDENGNPVAGGVARKPIVVGLMKEELGVEGGSDSQGIKIGQLGESDEDWHPMIRKTMLVGNPTEHSTHSFEWPK